MISEKWVQIPVAPMYEISQRGDVRNIKTGRLLKPYVLRNGRDKGKRFHLHVEGHRSAISFHQTSLLWLTHGFIPKSETHSSIRVPVIISHGNERRYFESCNQAAKFLAERVHYSTPRIAHHLARRREEIYGWRINYQR